MDIEKKNKVKKVCLITYLVISTILSLILIICCCVAIPNIKKSDGLALKDNEVSYNINRENKKLVSYDNEQYEITLTSNELNNYTFSNFKQLLIDNAQNTDYVDNTIITYNSLDYTIYDVDLDVGYIQYENESTGNKINFNVEFLNVFSFFDFALDDTAGFEYSITWQLEASNYLDIKSAIELDIQANESNINDSIFGTLTTSVVAFIGSLSSGIVAMTSIFYTNNALTVIGLLSVIVVAVALSYWLFRLIIGLIRMRG